MSQPRSFIDIAVLDGVRERFASGEAMVVLSAELDEVIWANGPGAELLGFEDFSAIVGQDPGLSMLARRQIRATRGYPDIGRNRPLALRLIAGPATPLLAAEASELQLADAERALLIAIRLPEETPAGERRARAISGLFGEGQHVALLDSEGAVVDASPYFQELGLSGRELTQLAREVRSESDRLVKRMIPTQKGRVAAGIAQLDDDLCLLMLVEAETQEEETAAASFPAQGAPLSGMPGDGERAQRGHEQAVERLVEETQTVVKAEIDEIQAEPADIAHAAPVEPPPAPKEPAAADHEKAARDDGWYFRADLSARGDAPVREDTAPFSSAPVRRELPSGPVRFVWRTDAEGRFSMIGEEFVAAIGARAADVIGRPFEEVARHFGFDPDGDVAQLLARRDTWSGKMLMWPLEGTDLKVPLDLAALPVYDRDRNFQGFRGFGVARMGEAVADPDAVGLHLNAAFEEMELPAVEPEPRQEEPAGDETEDPFRGEVPALELVPRTENPAPGKVISIATRRPPQPERTLSNAERLNFREIGERLRNSGIAAYEAAESAARTARDVIDAHDAEIAGNAAQADMENDGGTTAEQAELPHRPKEETAADDTTETATAGDAVEREPAAAPVSLGMAALEVLGIELETLAPAAADANQPQDDRVPETTSAAVPPSAERLQAAEERDVVMRPRLPAGFVPSAFMQPTPAFDAGLDLSLLSRLPMPVLIHAGDRLHYANREFLVLTGYESLDALREFGGLGAIFAEPLEGGGNGVERHPVLRRADGAELPVSAHLQAVDWQGGRALLLAIKPIAEPDAPDEAPAPSRDEIAAALDLRVAELTTIIDTATDGVVILDREGAIRSISNPAEALFGFESADVEGQRFETLFAIESQRAAQDYLDSLSNNGVASVLNDGREVIGREAKGRFIPLFMTIGKLPQGSGYCAVLRDITQWKRAEEELTQARSQAERASSQKTDFLARVSHEIRTPLNAIIGFSELMIDEKFGPISNERYRDYLRDVNRSGNHVLDLVNDLLDISKIEAGEQELNYEAVSLNDTLGETVAMMQPQANRERVIIRSSFASRLPDVVADLRNIRQIALNLLSNAIRYTQAGGQVIVSTSYEASGDIVMRVRDTGIGMSPPEIEQALKPFKQVNAVKRPRGDGTGLGLPLTKAMVEANRARFAIHSTPGEGTLVEVVFPATRVLAH